jgi:hypothetical protein
MTLPEINNTPILHVLDKLWISYKRAWWYEYSLQRNTGEYANWWKANTQKNIVGDFSHWEWGGKVFWFVMQFLNISKEQTFERFISNFWQMEQKQKPIIEVWNWLWWLSDWAKAFLLSRMVNPELVSKCVRWCYWWVACLTYSWWVAVWCNVRTTETDHSRRFKAVAWYSTKWVYMSWIDSKKDYLIVVEWLIDFLTIRQHETNVIWLKSNKEWYEDIQKLWEKYKIYIVPDNDEAWKEWLQLLWLDEYYLTDLWSFGLDIKDVNDLALNIWQTDILVELIKSNAKKIEKPIEFTDDDTLVQHNNWLSDRINTDKPSPFTFGLRTIDNVLWKFDYHQLHAIIWESWSGKTTFSFFQAMQNAKDHKVLYASLEMQPDKLIALRARKFTWIDAIHWSNKTFSQKQCDMMKSKIKEIEELQNLKIVWWNNDKWVHIDWIIKSLKKYVKLWYKLIYIDNLWFVQWTWSNKKDRIDYVIRSFQQFVQDNECTIVLIHHFTKWDKKSRMDRTFSDVMDTAKLEHDIDYWLFVLRDLEDEDLTPMEKATTYIQSKKDRENWIIAKIPIYFKSWWFEETYNI